MNTIPTNGEVIAYVIFGIIALLFVFYGLAHADSSSSVEITWGQRRDWARREREYQRRTR